MPDCSTLLQPLATSQETQALSLANINYTNQDFASLKSRLINLIATKFDTDFNDMVEGDLAIMLIELWAFMADTLSFKMDQQISELFIDTVTEIDNAHRLAKLVGFKPTPPIAARAMFSASINQVLTTDLVITAATPVQISSGDTPLVYELFPADGNNQPIFDQDIIIPAGSLVNTSVIGLEGSTLETTYTGTDQPNQSISLTNGPVLLDSVRVDVNGVRWTEVDAFTDSQPRMEYRLEFDAEYNAYIMFGNGRAGMVPTVGAQVVVTYRTGGGTQGNIIGGAVNTQRNYAVPGFAFSVPVTFANYTRGEFGYDGDQIEDIRRKLPSWIKTQDRAVTGEDFKTLADQFASPYSGQVGKSIAVLRNYGCAANIIDIYILAKNDANDLQPATDELKFELMSHLTEKKMLTDFVCIKDGVIVSVDVNIDLTVPKFFRKFREEILRKAELRAADFFQINQWEYAQNLREMDLVKWLADIKEVKNIDITFTTSDPDNSGSYVTAKYNEIIRPDNIVVTIMFE